MTIEPTEADRQLVRKWCWDACSGMRYIRKIRADRLELAWWARWKTLSFEDQQKALGVNSAHLPPQIPNQPIPMPKVGAAWQR